MASFPDPILSISVPHNEKFVEPRDEAMAITLCCVSMYLDDFSFANLELERFVRLSIAVKLLCIHNGGSGWDRRIT